LRSCQKGTCGRRVGKRRFFGLAARLETERQRAKGNATDPARKAVSERMVRGEIEHRPCQVAARVTQGLELRPCLGGISLTTTGQPDELRQILAQQHRFGHSRGR